MFLVIDGLTVPVALNQGTRGDRPTAGEITEMFDGSLQSSARGFARVWEVPTHPLPIETARALESLARSGRRVEAYGDALDADSPAPVDVFVRLERLRFGKYADGERRAITITLQEADPLRLALTYRPGFGNLTHSRADASAIATYIDANGVLQTVSAATDLRDSHYIGGVRHTLLEPSRQNVLASPNTLSSWTAVGTAPLTGSQSDPAGGTDGWLVEDNDSGIAEGFYTTASFTGDAAKAASIRLKAGTAGVSSVGIYDATAAAWRHRVDVTWASDGTPSLSTATGSGTLFAVRELSDGWYEISFNAAGVIAANTNRFYLYPAGTTAAATGTVYAYVAQAEDGASPTSMLNTTTARSADTAYIPLPTAVRAPTALAVYWRGVLLGNVDNGRIWQISSAANADPRLLVLYNQSTGKFTLTHDTGSSATSAVSTGDVANVGSSVEIVALLASDGAPTILVSVNGGTVSSDSGSSLSLASNWSDSRLYLNSAGSSSHLVTATRDVKVAYRGGRTPVQGTASEILRTLRHL